MRLPRTVRRKTQLAAIPPHPDGNGARVIVFNCGGGVPLAPFLISIALAAGAWGWALTSTAPMLPSPLSPLLAIASAPTAPPSVSPSAFLTPSPSASPTLSPSPSPSITPTPSPSPTVSPSITPTPSPSPTAAMHCGFARSYPLEGGHWDAATPPYYTPPVGACPAARVYDAAMLNDCLAPRGNIPSRRLFFMGDSFSRGYAFSLAAFLNHRTPRPPSRDEQKRVCAKGAHAATQDYSCALSVGNASSEEDASFRVMWRQNWGDPLSDNDFCVGQRATECHATFFGRDPHEGDVLISNIGRGYVEDALRNGRAWDDAERERGMLREFDAFRSSGVFRGMIIWISLSPADPMGTYSSYNPHIEELNAFLVPRLHARGVRVIDARALLPYHTCPRGECSDAARKALWVDAVHPPDTVYVATALLALEAACARDIV